MAMPPGTNFWPAVNVVVCVLRRSPASKLERAARRGH